MNVSKLTNTAVTETIEQIFTSLLAGDMEMQRVVLCDLIENVLNPLAEYDFFGTEGWEHWANLED